jgi:thiamine kinase-like enzyme
LGEDIPEHGVYRFNELAASRAAFSCGISPEVVHAESGAMVLLFIEGKTLVPENLREHSTIQKVVSLLKKCHLEMPQHLPGSTLIFWVFQVLRGYANTLREGKSRMIPELSRFMEINRQLEKTVGAVEMRFGHNDLLAGNFIDDGQRLWLIDWDYAGFNSPLFDLANLASNNEYAEILEKQLLEMYFEKAVSPDLWKRYFAMKCASLLREAMWSMVSEIHSTLDFDYVQYTSDNLDRFEKTYANFNKL